MPKPSAGPSVAGRLTGIVLTLLLLVLVASAAYVYRYLTVPLPVGAEPKSFTLEPGTTMRGAANQLASQGIVEQPWLLTWVARATGQASKIKAGSYEFSSPLTVLGLLDKLSDGDVSSATLTLVEGWNWRQVKAALARHPHLRHDSAALDDAALMKAIGAQEMAPEGMFFPDTYHFAKGSSDLKVLARAYQAMQKQLSAAWEARAANLPLKSPYEAVVLASIVEKETGRPADRGLIASVFVNRLRIGMRLQTDPTVIYGLGERFDGNLRRVDLETDTLYNTYTRAGLTPTPISMPGRDSLLAAVNPASNKLLYFVAKGDGASYFSETLEQHNQAVRRYQLGAR